ncbi:unnamed protein product [Symbiodinium sp. CCMP2456]|nr:unnamed protein product [Symbiodinium sp. CCMP2456]
MNNWYQDFIYPSHVDLGLGARAFLHFPPPKISSSRGKSFLAGSVHACIEGNGTFYAVSAEKRGIRQCQTRPIFRTFRSKDFQTYDFRKLGAEAAKQGTSSLVFSWKDSSHVAMKLFVGSVTVEARLTELVDNNTTNFSLSATCHKCTLYDGGQWMSYMPEPIRQYWQYMPMRPAQSAQDPAVNGTTQPGGAQGSLFWILADNSTQMVSIGRGSIPGKDEVLSLQIKGGGSLAHQFGVSKAIWNVSSGMARHFCTPSIPATLNADGHGTIRLSTSLLEGLFWARSQQLVAYASNTSRNVLDAVLRNDLQVGKMHFTVDTDTASSSGKSPLLWLSVAGARVRTSCPSRQEPLFAASVQHMRSAATAQGRKEADGGSLAISVTVHTGEHAAPDVSDFRLHNPQVPMDDSVPTFLLTDIVQAMNMRLEHITLHIPRELAQFIPCPMIKGKCRNMRLYSLSKQHDAGGYLEFIDAEAAAAETFAAEQPKLASSSDKQKDEGIVTSLIACILWLLWLLNLGLSVWTSWEWVVSSVTLSILCLAWHFTGPFAGFSESAFSDLGISKQDSPTDVIECMQRCNYAAVAATYVCAIWPLVIATVRRVRQLLSVVAFAARAAEVPRSLTKLFEASTAETVLGHILFSALVCVSQLAFIIVIPLRVNLGKQVALHVASSSENWYPGTAVDIIKAVLGNSDFDIHRATGTFVSCSFTALYVSHLGLYLIFFLLALSPGVFIGALVFTTMHWSERQVRGMVDMSTSFILMMELLPSAAILGAFTIAYQILGGNSTWWLAYGIIGVCRPLFSVPLFRMLHRQEREQKPMGTILSLAAAYIGLSLVGISMLWNHFHRALEGLSGSTALHTPFSGLSMSFVASQFVTLGWVIAISMYSILQDIAWNSSKILKKVKRGLQDAAGELIRRTVAGRLFCIKSHLSPEFLKHLWQQSFPWIIWTLEMDALVSLYYHAVKIVWLGLMSDFFLYEVKALLLMLFTWPLQSDQDLRARLEQLPRVDSGKLDFSWTTAAGLLFLCIAGSWWTLDGRGVSALRNTMSGRNSFGFSHGLLAFLRENLIRDGLPHTWGIVQSKVAAEFGIEQLRKFLAKNKYYSGSQHTVLDQPFLEYQWCLSLSFTFQALLLLLVFASAVCEHNGWKDRSQTCAFAAAGVAMMSALSTFVPNYMQLTQLPQEFAGCGTRFDSLVQFMVSRVLGMMFGALLGMQAFGVLFAIPVSAVRGIWLVMMQTEMRRCMHQVLRGSMWLLALLIPCVTIFPLLFFNQLTEDAWSQNIVLGFWVVPSLVIVFCSKQTNQSWFYFLWLTTYLAFMGVYLLRQACNLGVKISDILAKIDLPWLWSTMHADFCLTNVFVTDLVWLALHGVMEDSEAHGSDSDMSPLNDREPARTCLAIQASLPLDDVHFTQLPGLESKSEKAGVTCLHFETAAFAQAAASTPLSHGRLVPLASFVPLEPRHG